MDYTTIPGHKLDVDSEGKRNYLIINAKPSWLWMGLTMSCILQLFLVFLSHAKTIKYIWTDEQTGRYN